MYIKSNLQELKAVVDIVVVVVSFVLYFNFLFRTTVLVSIKLSTKCS